MANLFGVDIGGLLASALGGKLLPVTLKVRTPGTTYDASNPTSGPRYTETSYACRGACEVTETLMDGDLVRMQTGEMTILLKTISTAGIRPKAQDVVTFIPPGSTVAQDATITEASYDPAGASALLKLRG